jgi:hypothetical protein
MKKLVVPCVTVACVRVCKNWHQPAPPAWSLVQPCLKLPQHEPQHGAFPSTALPARAPARPSQDMHAMRAIARQQRLFSTAPEIKRVGVVGLGLMGHGIAQTAAEKGFEVVAIESEARFLDAGMARIESSVKKLSEKAVKKGKMSEADAAVHVATTLSRALLRPGIISPRCACVCAAVLTAGSRLHRRHQPLARPRQLCRLRHRGRGGHRGPRPQEAAL